jgi:hypothetical protein
MNSKVFCFGCLGLLSITPGIAQAPGDATGEAVLKTTTGAFKITSPGDKLAFGKIKMAFKGSILIVGYQGATPIAPSGGLRVEYKDDKRQRVEYFGDGTITLDGKFRAIQWFGRNLNMTWNGMGIVRLYGEFDKNGDTGTFEVKGDKLRYWGTGGMTLSLPSRASSLVAPQVNIKKSGG